MSRRERDFRNRNKPDRWQPPSKADRMAAKTASQIQLPEPSRPLSMTEELSIAAMDRTLPNVDLHGLFREDVCFEIDRLLDENPGRCVRVIYGHGRGIIANEVMRYIQQEQIKRKSRILGSREDVGVASIVLRVA